MDLQHLISPEGIKELSTLTLLLVTLALDNVIFIGALASKLNPIEQKRARMTGMFISLFLNLILILTASHFLQQNELARHILLGIGGAFLLGKGIIELNNKFKHKEHHTNIKASFWPVIIQTAWVDLIFSVDGTITAIGLSNDKIVQVTGILLSVIIMFSFAFFITKMLVKYEDLAITAYLFLALIGATLIFISFGHDLPRDLVYGMMGFGLLVQICNIAANKAKEKRQTIHTGELGLDMTKTYISQHKS